MNWQISCHHQILFRYNVWHWTKTVFYATRNICNWETVSEKYKVSLHLGTKGTFFPRASLWKSWVNIIMQSLLFCSVAEAWSSRGEMGSKCHIRPSQDNTCNRICKPWHCLESRPAKWNTNCNVKCLSSTNLINLLDSLTHASTLSLVRVFFEQYHNVAKNIVIASSPPPPPSKKFLCSCKLHGFVLFGDIFESSLDGPPLEVLLRRPEPSGPAIVRLWTERDSHRVLSLVLEVHGDVCGFAEARREGDVSLRRFCWCVLQLATSTKIKVSKTDKFTRVVSTTKLLANFVHNFDVGAHQRSRSALRKSCSWDPCPCPKMLLLDGQNPRQQSHFWDHFDKLWKQF